MANYELGQVGLNPRGVYNSTIAYKKLDCVSHEGSSYIALEDNTGVPVTNTSVWMYLAVGADSDVAWNYLDLILSTTPGNYGAGRMRYKKVGNHVFIAGSVNVTPGSNVILFQLPQGYRPNAGTATVIRPCSGSRVARVTVAPDGNFYIEWVKNLSDGSSYASTSIWVECSIDFWTTGA